VVEAPRIGAGQPAAAPVVAPAHGVSTGVACGVETLPPAKAEQLARLAGRETIGDLAAFVCSEGPLSLEFPERLLWDREFVALFGSLGRSYVDKLTRLPLATASIPPDEAEARIVRLAVRHGCVPDEIARLCWIWRRKCLAATMHAHGMPEHGAAFKQALVSSIPPTDHYRRIIGSAVVLADRATAAHLLCVASAATADEVFGLAGRALGVRIAGFLRIGADRPRYALGLADGRAVELGTSKDLAQKAVRAKLYDATGVQIPRFPPEAWGALWERLAPFATAVAGHEPDREVIFESVEQYLQAKLERSRKDAVGRGAPFRESGRTYVRAEDFAAFLGIEKADAITILEGWKSKSVTVRSGPARTSRRYYASPLSPPVSPPSGPRESAPEADVTVSPRHRADSETPARARRGGRVTRARKEPPEKTGGDTVTR